jgi:hypothetical protein
MARLAAMARQYRYDCRTMLLSEYAITPETRSRRVGRRGNRTRHALAARAAANAVAFPKLVGLATVDTEFQPYGQQRQRDLGFVDEASANPLKVERMTVTLFTVRKTVDNIRV